MEGVSTHFWSVVVRKLVLATVAAWVIWLPSIAHAQWRGEGQGPGQGRPRPQIQQQGPDIRRGGGGFVRMLRDIAGARLDRAHADKRSEGPGGDKNKWRR
jgi:hypothetical protein